MFAYKSQPQPNVHLFRCITATRQIESISRQAMESFSAAKHGQHVWDGIFGAFDAGMKKTFGLNRISAAKMTENHKGIEAARREFSEIDQFHHVRAFF